MEKTREVVDQASKEKGRKLELSLIVPATEKVNNFHGLALKEWADAKLIDLISVAGSLQTRSNQENVSNIDLSFFEAISQNSGLPFFVKLPVIWNITQMPLRMERQELCSGMELITSRFIPMDGNGFIFSEAGKMVVKKQNHGCRNVHMALKYI